MRAWSSAGVGTAAAMVACLREETTIFQHLGRLWKPRATETLWGALAWICRSSTEGANSHWLGLAGVRRRWRTVTDLDLHEFYLKISTKVLSA